METQALPLQHYQSKLFPYAYNILGSVDDALDIVQDVMVNYPSIAARDLDNETGYLVRSIINKSITLKSKKKRTHPSVWLPEPIITDNTYNPTESGEILSYSLMILLEYLNVKERAVFILKEGFDYTHEEIAECLNIKIENSRKLLSRAHHALRHQKENFKEVDTVSNSLLQEYYDLIQSRDIKRLETKLHKEVIMLADGGEKVKIVRATTIGNLDVSNLLIYLYNHYHHTYTYQFKTINHQSAIVFYKDQSITNCQVFQVNTKGEIEAIYSIVDPDKLKKLR